MINLTDANTYPANVRAPADGDPADGAEFQAGLQDLANRTNWALLRWDGGATGSGAVQLPISGAANDTIVAADGWYRSGNLWVQNNVSVGAVIWVDLRLPHGVTLESVHVQINGNGGGGGAHGGLPTNLPRLDFYELDPSTGNTVVNSWNATDGSANLAAYETNHSININSISHTVNAGYKYMAKLTGEHGTNAAALKLAWFGLLADWSPAP